VRLRSWAQEVFSVKAADLCGVMRVGVSSIADLRLIGYVLCAAYRDGVEGMEGGRRMRVLTWNLWGRGGDWRRRRDAIARRVPRMGWRSATRS
jgi:hypothetical protein